MEREARESKAIYLEDYSIQMNGSAIKSYFYQSPLTKKAQLEPQLDTLIFEENCIVFTSSDAINSYIASIASALVRDQLIETGKSLTFETVMSSADKIDVLKKSRSAGFKNYLYYIATDDPDINIQRVHNRVQKGGHGVPEDKIRQRYHRSLELLAEAIKLSDRAFIFDNSGAEGSLLLAEVTPNGKISIKIEEVPSWFYHGVIQKFTPSD